MLGALWVGLMLAVAGNPARRWRRPRQATAGLGSFVAVMQPPDTDDVLVEAASRIRSELAASGLEGRLVDCSQRVGRGPALSRPRDPRDDLARARGRRRRDQRPGDHGGRARARPARPGDLARRRRRRLRPGGARRRASARRPPQRAATPAGRPPAARARRGGAEGAAAARAAARPPRWLLTTGAAVLGSPGGNEPGVGPAAGLALGAGAIFGPHVLVIASFAGPFDNALGPT